MCVYRVVWCARERVAEAAFFPRPLSLRAAEEMCRCARIRLLFFSGNVRRRRAVYGLAVRERDSQIW